MANTLQVRGDRWAAFDPQVLAIQADNLTPLTIQFDEAALDLFGTTPVAHIDWLLPDQAFQRLITPIILLFHLLMDNKILSV